MDDDNINKISTPVTFSIIYGSAYCLLVLSLWLLNKYIVAEIQSKFHANPPKTVGVMCDNWPKNDAFDFSPKTFTSRRIMNMENGANFCIKKKNQTHPLLFLMCLIFLVF